MNKYYIRLNGNSRITDIISSAQSEILETDILIGEGFGTQFRASSEVLSDELQMYADEENVLRNEIRNEKYGLYQLEYVDGIIQKVSEEILKSEYIEPEQISEPTNSELNEKIDITMVGLTETYEATMKVKEDNTNTNVALTEVFELCMQQQTTIEELSTKVAELEGKQ